MSWRDVLCLLALGATEGRELLRREVRGAGEIAIAPEPTRAPTCQDGVSSYECKGTKGYDQSCIFHCAYVTPDQGEGRWVVHLLMENRSQADMVDISDWDMPAIQVENPVTVKITRFPSKAALQDYARTWQLQHQRGLSLLFRALWQDRWAHALFDGLYPGYVSLARFGLADHAFTPVALLSNYTHGLDCQLLQTQLLGLSGQGIYTGTACQMEEAFRLFASKGGSAPLIHLNDLWDGLSGAMVFEHLVSGSGHLGEYASVLTLPEPEDVPHNLLGRFADRLLRSYGLAPAARDGQRLQVLITGNKRMTSEEVAQLSRLVGSNNSMKISYVDWFKVQPFRAQLELLRSTDVMISGIGTALFYSAFLPPGSVCVNTGWRDPIPTYGEDVLGMSNQRTRFLYMPLEKVRKGVTAEDVEAEIRKAATLVSQGARVTSDENLSIFGRIMKELLEKSEVSRMGLQGKGQNDGGFLCHQRPTGQTSLSDLVFERRLTAKNLIFELPEPILLTQACQLDVALLRELKRKHHLTSALGLASSGCDCVACEACGLA